MKMVMIKTHQFGGYHYKKGEIVYARPISHNADLFGYILCKQRNGQPFGPTVFKEFLFDIASPLGGTMIDNDKEIDAVNAAYEAEDYDRYEELIERYAKKFGVSYNLFEDWCTDVRLFGER